MRVILATVGTDGDVFPYVGLAVALRARGHRVTLAAPEPYRACAETLGLQFCPLVTAAELDRFLADPDLWHPLRSGIMSARWGGPMISRQYEALAMLVGEPGSVLVANPGVFAARLIQEKLGTPTATLLLQPGLVPSIFNPPKLPVGIPSSTWLPLPLRKIYWLGLDAFGYAVIAPSLNRVRADLGLPPVRRIFRWWFSPDLVIALFPNWYAPPQPDWPPQFRLAGFGRFDGEQQPLPEDVRKFCEEESPPIVFTLGTGMQHAADFFRTAVAACDALGARGLLLTKYPDMIPPHLSARVRHCTFAPFRQLLPLCRAVVHHGGIGTTAAALASGCPQLVLPLAWDQPDNAARVAKLGVGLTLGSRHRSSKQMCHALSQLMAPDVRDRCHAIASQADREDGLAIAAGWIEEFAATAEKSGARRKYQPSHLGGRN